MARGLLVAAVIWVGATCRLSDLIGTPKGAVLAIDPVAPDSLIDSAAVGSTALREDTISVTNIGGGDLHWTAHSKQGSPWLLLPVDSGTAPTPLWVQFDPAGLANGMYYDTVVVQATTGGGSLEAPVRLEIHPCRPTSIQVSDTRTDTLNAADCGAPHRSGSQAQVFSFTGQAGDSASIVLTAGFDGHLVVDTTLTPTTPTTPPLGEADGCLGDNADPCLYYVRLPRTGTYYIEVTSASAADSGLFNLRLLHPGRLPDAPDSLDQRLLDSTTSVAPGATVGTSSLLLRAFVSDSDRVDSLYLEAEVQPVGTAFTNSSTGQPGPMVGNGQPAWVRVSGLADNTLYHWQVRTKDWTGRPSPWDSFPASPAFNVQLGGDPTPPTSLLQFQSDGSTLIPVGQTANGATVVFKGQVNDPDAGNRLQLQVEVKPIGTNFDSSANASSPPVASGATAVVPVVGLSDGTSYHWQARAVDNTSRSSGWVSFPTPVPNPEGDADFRVQIPPQQLVFIVQPAVDTAGRPIRPAPQVAVQDQNGNTITSFTGDVSIAIAPGTGTPGAILSGTPTVAASAGVATFSNVIIDKAGTGYRLLATAGTINSAPSSAFNVVPGPTTQLVFTTHPPDSTVAGAAMSPQVVVTAQDDFSNPTAFGGTVLLSIANNGGTPVAGTLTGGGPATASNGAATFSNLRIDKAGPGYTLRATSPSQPSLRPDTSTAFAIVPGQATHLSFTVQPSNAAANGVIAPPVRVTGLDANDNIATGFTGNVTVAIGTNPPGNGILSGTLTTQASLGHATFSDLRIDKIGTGYTLTASATGPTGTTSVPFNIVNSPISSTLSTVVANPSTITASGGSSISTITVTARDQGGNPVQGATVVLSATGAGNTVTQPATTTNASGVATGTLSSTFAPEGKVITAVISGVTIAQTPTVTVNPGLASSLEFTTPPTNTTAGVAINGGAGGVVVTAHDQFGNTATGFTSVLTMVLGANPAGGVLSGTLTATPTAGVASFSNLRIIKAGAGYRLQASGGALTSPLSSAFVINAAPPNKLLFTTQPQETPVLARIDSAIGGVVVTVQDSVGNTTPFGGTVRIIIGVNAGGGTLTGGGSIAAPTGVATFPNLTINALGTGYTLVTLSSGPALISDESDPFNIIPGPAKTLNFTVQPTQTVAGQNITPAVQVTARDIQGNTATGFTGNVTVAIGTNGGTPPGTLGGTLSHLAAAGVANFNNLNIDNAGPGYTLTAATPALPTGPVTGATSNPFNIVSGGVSATLSTITRSPTNITASGGTITSTITVTAKDNLGNPIQGLTVVLAATPVSGNTLTQPVGTTNASGVATGTLASTVAETKTVSATIDGTLINATTTVVVNPAAPKLLLFNVHPNTTVATQTIRPATGVQVEVRDTFNNRVTNANISVNIAILNNPPTPQGTLSGTTTATQANGRLVAGIATFNNLSIDKVATGYTLLTSSTGLVSDASNAFDITVGSATKLGFLQQPTTTSGGATISPPITVEVQDAGGNRVGTATNAVGIAILNNAGGGTLSGDNNNNAVSGVATFMGMSIDNAGTGYTLQATATGLTPAPSSAFDITVGGAAKLGFVQHPTSTTGGATISPAVTVEIQDAGGNRVLGATNSVTLAIGTNPGPNAVLSGTNPVSAINGVATFNGMSIDSAGNNYTLVATAGGLTQATSNTFNITVGAATKLGFLQQPTSASGGATISPPITIEVRDAGGNRVNSAANVTLAIANNPGSGGLSGDSVNNAVSGLATFNTLSINNVGTGYTLLATATGLTSATSASFNITVGAATKLGFVQQPTQASGGATISPAVTVEILDAGDNRVNSSAMVALAIGTNPGPSAALTGGGAVAAVNGLATFPSLSIDSAGTGFTLVATSGSLTQATSNTFNITVGAAAKLGFVQQPTQTGGGGVIAPDITVAVQDAGGNRVTGGAPHTVDIAILNNAGPGGVLSGDASNNTSSGLATFNTLSIDVAGNGYTLRATSTGLTGVTSNAFNIVVGAPAKLAFLQQPTTEIAGVAIAPAITVRILDAGNNFVGTATNTVDIAILNNAGPGGTLSGDASNPASSGVATFNTLSIDKSGTGYTLQATSGSLTAVTSAGFDITPAAAVALFFTVQPSNTAASTNMNPAVVVTARDQFGNTATGFTGAVTLDFTPGTNGESAGIAGNIESAIAGVATFNNLQIDTIDDGSGYTLDASAASVPTGATSDLFFIL